MNLHEKLQGGRSRIIKLRNRNTIMPHAAFNECNLQFTRQQSKISALKQELEFKSNQLNDLQHRWKAAMHHS